MFRREKTSLSPTQFDADIFIVYFMLYCIVTFIEVVFKMISVGWDSGMGEIEMAK